MKYSIVVFLLTVWLALSLAQKTENETESNQRQGRFDERKFRFDQDKKDLTQFLNTKNIVKTVVKLLFGSTEESSATSRQVLNVLVKVLDMLKSSFGQRARSSSSRGIRDSIDDAAVAGISVVKGYVRSVLTNDEHCIQKHTCEASALASREGRELGYLIAQMGGYASSYLLESQKSVPFNANYEASRQGRSGADCTKLYQTCNEAD
ncbi:unnamed protein product [Medioppia subpectinata]|uniref:Uncharacterized protein n=1 Tax=Medioppia subpectinata TaxID=1979941 RepID=A0A7R9KWY9_9ACAR|nr:unnamed protein product [Medioppia subpectinata]CAG2111337.1 unnamed protein product [Medioppia subpectinata]